MRAKFIKQLDNFTGEARLYEVDPPAKWTEYTESGQVERTSKHVAVSAAYVPSFLGAGGPETYIFPCDEKGKVVSWGELDGSYQGGLDHEQALRDAGYTVE